MFRTFSILGTVLLFVACAEKKEEESDTLEISSESILEFQNKRAEATPIETAQFGEALTYMFSSSFQSEHWHSDEVSTDEEVPLPSESCFETGVDAATKYSITDNRLTMQTEFQLDDACAAEEKALAQADLATAGSATFSEIKTLKTQLVIDCEKSLAGVSVENLESLDFEATCGYPTGLARDSSFEGTTTYWYIENGETKELAGALSLRQFLLNAEGGPCVWNRTDSTVSEENGCVAGSYLKTGLADNPMVSYSFAIRKDLVGTIGPHDWYDSGKLEVQVNDWEGTLTYAGRDQAPSYAMSKDGTTVTGVFDPFSLIHAPKSWLKPNLKFLKAKPRK